MKVKTVEKMADIANLFLSQQEKAEIAKDLEVLLQCFDKLNQLDIEKIEPSFYPISDKNVLRKDIVQDSLSIEQVLANASDKCDRYFRVPRIIEE